MNEEIKEQEEKNALEYKPLFQRTKKDKSSWASDDVFEQEEVIGLDSEEEKENIGTGLITTLVSVFEEFKTNLEEKIKEWNKKLKDTTFKTEDRFLLDVQKAKEALGLPEGELTFEDYKKALEENEMPAGEFLLEIIEDQIEDINGAIDLELYPEYVESLKELELLERYIQKVILSNLSKEPIFLSGDDWEEKLIQAEKEWGQKRQAAGKTYLSAYEKQKEAILYQYQDIEKTRGQLHITEKEKKLFDVQASQLAEAFLLAKTKIEDTADTLQLVDDNMERTPFETPSEIIDSLLVLIDTKEKWNDSLTNLSLMLKLSVDVSNKEKHHIKTSLRHTYAISNQEKVLDELTVFQGLFQEKTIPISHELSAYREEPSETMTLLLNQVVVGLNENNKQKKAKVKELYTITNASSSLRKAKVSEVLKKDDARQGYHLLKKIAEQTRESGMPQVGFSSDFLTN